MKFEIEQKSGLSCSKRVAVYYIHDLFYNVMFKST